MDRRDFLRLSAVAAAGLVSRTSYAQEAATELPPAVDLAGAARKLAPLRVVAARKYSFREGYPRETGGDARRGPTGRYATINLWRLGVRNGATGWGVSSLQKSVVDRFVGARFSDIYDLRTGTLGSAHTIDDMLHDLVGNTLGVPVYRLIGAAGTRELPICSPIFFEDLVRANRKRGIQAVVDACQQDYDAGYRAFKIKVGRGARRMVRGGFQRDVAVVRAVRAKFPDCVLMVDADDAFSVEGAIAFVNAVADMDLYWIEEPFEENREDLLKLREAMETAGCKAMIADGETRAKRARVRTQFGGYTEEFAERLLKLGEEGLVNVFVMMYDIVGMTCWRSLLPELARKGIKASPAMGRWTPTQYRVAHLGAGVGNVCMIEGLRGSIKEISYGAYRLRNGNLMVPERPGFGTPFVV
jgi:L-alanine-DL-glutamate epimerase-like enolase superfamily enzyme